MTDKIQVYSFCFNNYDKYKTIQACMNSWKEQMPYADIHILKDDFINNVPEDLQTSHYKFCKSNNIINRFITDSLRLTLSKNSKYYLYLDLDTYLPNPVSENRLLYLNNGLLRVFYHVSTVYIWKNQSDRFIDELISFYNNTEWTLDNYHNLQDHTVCKEVFKENVNDIIPMQRAIKCRHIGFSFLMDYIVPANKEIVISNDKEECLQWDSKETCMLYFGKEEFYNESNPLHTGCYPEYLKEEILSDIQEFRPSVKLI